MRIAFCPRGVACTRNDEGAQKRERAKLLTDRSRGSVCMYVCVCFCCCCSRRRDEAERGGVTGQDRLGEALAAPAHPKDAMPPKEASGSGSSSRPPPPLPPPPSDRDRQLIDLQGAVSRFLRSATKLSSKMYANGQRMMNTIGGLFGGFK